MDEQMTPQKLSDRAIAQAFDECRNQYSDYEEYYELHDWVYARARELDAIRDSQLRKFTGVGELERTGYIPEGSAAERLDWVMRHISGRELRNIGIELSECTQDNYGPAIDKAMGVR